MMSNYANLLTENNIQVEKSEFSKDNVEVIYLAGNSLVNAVKLLKYNESSRFDMLMSISGTDYNDFIEVAYHLYSSILNKKIVLKVNLSRQNPEIETLTFVFSAADWHERETFDLLGVEFKNHPNLKRILLPEGWIGHPLRKDYDSYDERLVWNLR